MPGSRLLTTDDWPEAELRAAVLAGELVPVGPCWASPATPQDPALRASAASWVFGDARLVASGRTAAWIWGAASRPPDPIEASVPPQLRIAVGPGLHLREVALQPVDVVRLGSVQTVVTTPERTAVDLLRTPGEWDTERAAAVDGLLTIGAVSVDELHARLSGLGTIPMARQAERRLRGLLSAR
ncbi:transcriptional regulator with AbiEi antitoxin domain of type IV toxin-antitoxin system [Curtobacterium sp. PhB172]|uniref:type IV toxin-antitoxin system AbiEi family antitoxin n=1 Tax=Curtobacterium sp. PhB172 TaxID=2485196 RepID=UPI000F4B70CE|nr:type IV toxin-antitoxin system AbiEi family antitoxin [Curtobacterium sp. PhB172]ROS67283.1 transcriptional regulator with AbiEi antitoxin domain of type IV toxin-antitoxin system [Curtobacterium sp. PhB172]